MFSFSSGGGGLKGRSTDENNYGVYYKNADSDSGCATVAVVIFILNQDKKKLGYVPERDNMVFSRLMDAGKLLIAKVISVRNTDGFYRVSIGIYLVDY